MNSMTKQNQSSLNHLNQMAGHIQRLQATLNEVVLKKAADQAEIQTKINSKLETVMGQVMAVLARRN